MACVLFCLPVTLGSLSSLQVESFQPGDFRPCLEPGVGTRRLPTAPSMVPQLLGAAACGPQLLDPSLQGLIQLQRAPLRASPLGQLVRRTRWCGGKETTLKDQSSSGSPGFLGQHHCSVSPSLYTPVDSYGPP